jgi:hypothetical protein
MKRQILALSLILLYSFSFIPLVRADGDSDQDAGAQIASLKKTINEIKGAPGISK